MGASELGTEYKKLRKWARANLVPVCCFCGKYIDRELKWPDKWCWVANHIIPLNQGGDPYSRDNIAPAHNHCNSSWQDRTPKPPRSEIDW